MKKIAIVLLSLLICSPVFGAYSGLKRALGIAGKVAYGGYLLYPGVKSSINKYNLMKIIENDSPKVDENTAKEVRESLKQRGIKNTDNIAVYQSNIRVAAYMDFRRAFGPKAIVIGHSWEQLDPAEKNVSFGHEGSHIKNNDQLVIETYNWLTRPMGHAIYYLALKHPILRVTQAITSSKTVGTLISATSRIVTTETTHQTLLGKPYWALFRAQELRSDTDLIDDPNELISLGNLLLDEGYFIRLNEEIEMDRAHPHPLKRVANCFEKSKKLIPKKNLSTDEDLYRKKWQELEDKMDKSDRSLESLAIKSNTLFNLYFNTSDEIIEASEYPNPLKHSLECCEQAKKLQEEKARELLEKHLAQITNAQQDES